jgi:hypothetical protein
VRQSHHFEHATVLQHQLYKKINFDFVTFFA